MNYAIFRSEPIMTMSDLRGIGSHNKREKQAYNSNLDIKIELSKSNIELVTLNCKYTKGFRELTKEYEKEHNERMKTERKERQKSFTEMLNKSKNVVADELFDYAGVPSYLKTSKKSLDDKDKDDFEMSL